MFPPMFSPLFQIIPNESQLNKKVFKIHNTEQETHVAKHNILGFLFYNPQFNVA